MGIGWIETFAKSDCSWKHIGEYDSIKHILVATGAKSYAFIGKKEGKEVLIKDGVQIYSGKEIEHPMYISNGNMFSFVASIEGKAVLVKEGKIFKWYDAIYRVTYDSSWNNVAFVASKNGKKILVHNEKELGTYDDVVAFEFLDWGILVYVTRQKKKYKVFQGNTLVGEYDAIRDFIVNDTKTSFGFIARKKGNMLFVVDGKESKGYKEVLFLGYFPWEKKYVAFVKQGERLIVIQDGREIKVYERWNMCSGENIVLRNKVRSLWDCGVVFSPDGNEFSFVLFQKNANAQMQKYVVKNFHFLEQAVSLPVYGKGKSFSYIAKKENGKYVVIRDGKEEKEYSMITHLAYFPEGNHLVYVAKEWRNYGIVKDNAEFFFRCPACMLQSDGNAFVFSPSGNSVSLLFHAWWKVFLVKDGNILAKNYESFFPLYSFDGKEYTYVSRDVIWNTSIIKNGKPSQEYDRIHWISYIPSTYDLVFVASRKAYKENTTTGTIILWYVSCK